MKTVSALRETLSIEKSGLGATFLADTYGMDFFERVKLKAKAKGITIETAVNTAGLSRNAYNSYRKKGNLPRADEAVAIARALGVSVEYLVSGSDASDPWLREHADFLRDCKLLEAADRFGSVQRTVRTEADILRASATEARNASGA